MGLHSLLGSVHMRVWYGVERIEDKVAGVHRMAIEKEMIESCIVVPPILKTQPNVLVL